MQDPFLIAEAVTAAKTVGNQHAPWTPTLLSSPIKMHTAHSDAEVISATLGRAKLITVRQALHNDCGCGRVRASREGRGSVEQAWEYSPE